MTSAGTDPAAAQAIEAPANTARPVTNTRRRPATSASVPPVSSSAARATVYPVTTPCRPDTPAPRSRWMSRSATATTVLSSVAVKEARQVATRTSCRRSTRRSVGRSGSRHPTAPPERAPQRCEDQRQEGKQGTECRGRDTCCRRERPPAAVQPAGEPDGRGDLRLRRVGGQLERDLRHGDLAGERPDSCLQRLEVRLASRELGFDPYDV